MLRNRINLFNNKTIYEIYDFDFNLHVDFDKNICRGILISKENTLGPKIIYSYMTFSQNIPTNFDIRKYIKSEMEDEFISHLNKNVGLECFIRKNEVPSEVYQSIKGG